MIISDKEVDILVKNYFVFETKNTNDHCAYLSIGSIMFFEMIKNKNTHMKILNYYRFMYDFYMKDE